MHAIVLQDIVWIINIHMLRYPMISTILVVILINDEVHSKQFSTNKISQCEDLGLQLRCFVGSLKFSLL